jgi:hypothetical protein
MQFTVSVFPIHFKGRDIKDNATITSSVFQENTTQLECEIADLSLKTEVNDKHFGI